MLVCAGPSVSMGEEDSLRECKTVPRVLETLTRLSESLMTRIQHDEFAVRAHSIFFLIDCIASFTVLLSRVYSINGDLQYSASYVDSVKMDTNACLGGSRSRVQCGLCNNQRSTLQLIQASPALVRLNQRPHLELRFGQMWSTLALHPGRMRVYHLQS